MQRESHFNLLRKQNKMAKTKILQFDIYIYIYIYNNHGSTALYGLGPPLYIHARKVLLHAVNLRHGTDGFTSPPKEVLLRIFITLKNPSTSVGIEPANLGSSGEHANH
jgi:hypothetical protein